MEPIDEYVFLKEPSSIPSNVDSPGVATAKPTSMQKLRTGFPDLPRKVRDGFYHFVLAQRCVEVRKQGFDIASWMNEGLYQMHLHGRFEMHSLPKDLKYQPTPNPLINFTKIRVLVGFWQPTVTTPTHGPPEICFQPCKTLSAMNKTTFARMVAQLPNLERF
ncbi:hypothetical protein EJ02DRAFT_437782 [Clathrospora elynae]|uniref:Uncharacterized protein n=1 Tax=Clathrospora elynae TaxID=706981 RepID=A0A6A5SGD0_9PLEO|nr:hypothetical protein EJ02DRAFT_437782 [Clathrospora elynae]